MADPEIVVRGRGDFRDLNRDVAAAEARFSKMGSTIKRGLATSALAGTAALVKLGVDSVKAGSAAQQSIGATETVFGKYADVVIGRSKEAAEAVGLSANEYRELANVTGATLANAGTPLKQVTKLTAELTRRAAGMAATYGGTTKEAIESVSSLLRGEADPIERYGVSIKQSDVNARLAAQGLDKLTGSAKKQAEQQARLDLLMQQTSKTAGQFGRESDTIAGKGQRLSAKVEDLEAKFSDLLIPALSAAADWASEELVPALDDLHGWLSDNSDEFSSLASTVKDTVVPALDGAVNVVETAVDLFSDLPGPVKELGVQAGIAALVLPRLTAGMTVASKATTGLVTGLRNAETRTAALSSAARTAAGVGGMVALAQGADASNEAVKGLATTAGTTAVGFSLGGPWGALIGAAGGALWSLAGAGDGGAGAIGRLGQTAKNTTATWQTYAKTLDDVTGAITRATRVSVIQALQENDLLAQANQLNLSKRTIVDGILGEKAAREQLASAITIQKGVIASEFSAMTDANGNLSASEQKLYNDRLSGLIALEAEIGKIKDSTAAKAEEIAIIKKIPEAVVTRIQTPGAVDSKREIAELAATYSLTPKQIQTVIKMTNVKASKDEVVALQREIVETGGVKPGDAWTRFFGADLARAKKQAGTGRADVNTILTGIGDVDVKVKSGRFGKKLKADVDGMKNEAATGGQTVGLNLGAGLYGGLDTWVGPIQAKAYQMVRDAIAAANAAGDVHSPSRETAYTGRMLGEGLAVGMDATAPVVGRAAGKLGKKAVDDILAGVTGGLDGVENVLDRITKLVEKSVKGKHDEKREKQILKGLKDQYAALRANGRLQDEINAKLEDARALVEQATAAYNDYANAARDAVTATGDITQLGRQEDGTVSLTSLLNELENAANDADRFVDLSEKLAGMGLSKESIDQILAAGPSAALATVEAIETGGQAAVDQINALQGRLSAAGTRLGADMAGRYYQSGIDAAQGLVNGLMSQLEVAVAAGEALGAALLKGVKKKLKIKSPSRVMMGIGEDVMRGLDLGIDDTYAASIGTTAAASLVKGFDNPQLSADVLSAASGSVIQVEVRLTAEQLSAAQRGKAILLDIDAARTAGARAKAVTS